MAEDGVLNQLESLLGQFFSPSSTNEQKSEISESLNICSVVVNREIGNIYLSIHCATLLYADV